MAKRGQLNQDMEYGVAFVYHQWCSIYLGFPNIFHAATSPLNWYKIVGTRDLQYGLIWIEITKMFPMYVQSGHTYMFIAESLQF